MAGHMTAEQVRAELVALNDFLGVVSGYAKIDDERVRLARGKLTDLAASLSGMAADTWRPIETADTVGTKQQGWMICENVLLLMSDGTQSTGRYNTLAGKWFADSGGAAFDAWKPTHWRPLPAAPEPPHV